MYFNGTEVKKHYSKMIYVTKMKLF